MCSMLADLWNGNVCPIKSAQTEESQVVQLMEFVKSNYAELFKILNDGQKKVFDNYDRCVEEYQTVLSERAFCAGFSLCFRLLTEALHFP